MKKLVIMICLGLIGCSGDSDNKVELNRLLVQFNAEGKPIACWEPPSEPYLYSDVACWNISKYDGQTCVVGAFRYAKGKLSKDELLKELRVQKEDCQE